MLLLYTIFDTLFIAVGYIIFLDQVWSQFFYNNTRKNGLKHRTMFESEQMI